MRIPWPKWHHRWSRKPLLLRPATDQDVVELSSLNERCMRPYSEAFYPWDTHRFCDEFDSAEVEVLEYEDRIIGMLKCRRNREYLYLAELQLDADFRNCGIGTSLMRLTLSRARTLDVPVRLQVLRNNPARALYERLGFSQVGEGACYFVLEHSSF